MNFEFCCTTQLELPLLHYLRVQEQGKGFSFVASTKNHDIFKVDKSTILDDIGDMA